MATDTSRKHWKVFLKLWEIGTSLQRSYICDIFVSCLMTSKSRETTLVRIGCCKPMDGFSASFLSSDLGFVHLHFVILTLPMWPRFDVLPWILI